MEDNVKEKTNRDAEENPHKGHRERMRRKYAKGGLDILEKHEIMEYLLYFSYTKVDVNELAHKLKNSYKGSIVELLSDEVDEMVRKTGISRTAAINFSFIHDIIKMYNIEKNMRGDGSPITQEKIEEHLISYYAGLKRERIVLLTFNTAMTVMNTYVIQDGGISSAPINMNKIAETIFTVKASSVILAHNHLNESIFPSVNDIQATARINDTLEALNIKLLEHYTVAGTEIMGLKEFCGLDPL